MYHGSRRDRGHACKSLHYSPRGQTGWMWRKGAGGKEGERDRDKGGVEEVDRCYGGGGGGTRGADRGKQTGVDGGERETGAVGGMRRE
ncbi:hypothetical protein Pmani_030678 [Petrolisthes manimaculis]|uniref:Uncharacterized protein n=1 Tax=Petrolisthes manimaculis TaxID=1843537 RepID=A0AAE1NVI6_9EUCA|nr:hypothetical protein Pmani_030678 [Petrolisthes manimaculis]